jgi:ABC-type glutathione transport system ATPase component
LHSLLKASDPRPKCFRLVAGLKGLVIAGTASYLGTLLTSAPLPLLESACRSYPLTTDSTPHSHAHQATHAEMATPPPGAPSSTHKPPEDGGSEAGSGAHSYIPLGTSGHMEGVDGAAVGVSGGGGTEAVMVVQGFSCMTGQQRAVVRDLSFVLPAAERILLVGPSGVGKSCLLRALRGLWPYTAEWLSMTDQARTLDS